MRDRAETVDKREHNISTSIQTVFEGMMKGAETLVALLTAPYPNYSRKYTRTLLRLLTPLRFRL